MTVPRWVRGTALALLGLLLVLALGLAAGVAWLKTNQRTSGRWFTRSLNTDKNHFITHAGTAYALAAMRACEE